MMISDDMVAQYQRDGAVCIRQLFRPPEIEELRAGIELNLAVPSPRAKIASGADDPGRFVEDFCPRPLGHLRPHQHDRVAEPVLILQHCAERNLRHACQRFG